MEDRALEREGKMSVYVCMCRREGRRGELGVSVHDEEQGVRER